ncbi:MAG: RsmE family RNA methyltransferase [Chitinispirillaceae bacterium]|nr:RsmE family RNA methyltransferase [Chitinispirillaceae bacterium]
MPDRLMLDESETRHTAVLRLSAGDPLLVTDGKGTVYDCRHAGINRGELTCVIAGRTSSPRRQRPLHILTGLPERLGFETLVTDLTALGVERITPIVCAHCQQPWWSAWDRHSGRFFGKMIAAMKQSLYPWLPRLDYPVLIAGAKDLIEGGSIIADIDGIPFDEVLGQLTGRTAVIVGPPGGLTEDETALFENQVRVKIANTRLTTELAAVVIAGAIIAAAPP